jgi:hypothetical protein
MFVKDWYGSFTSLCPIGSERYAPGELMRGQKAFVAEAWQRAAELWKHG